MKLIKKITAGFLFTFAFICLTVMVTELFDRDITPDQKEDSAYILQTVIAYGIPATVAGTWLLWSLKKQSNNHTQNIFYYLLQQNQGKITVFQFAMEAQLAGTEAKQYLDQQAREFNAYFDVDDTGDIIYHFNLSTSNLKHLNLNSSNSKR